jgi:metacaspase-1
MITDDIIRDELACKIPEKCKLFALIDACHSESSLDLVWTLKLGKEESFILSKVGRYQETKGEVIMLSGCQDFDTSADIYIKGKGQGALTYSFVEVLKENNYAVTYDRLLSETRKYIKKNNLSKQVPCLSFGKSVKISSTFKP